MKTKTLDVPPMEPIGTLRIITTIYDGKRPKRITLATHRNVTQNEGQALAEEFCRANDRIQSGCYLVWQENPCPLYVDL